MKKRFFVTIASGAALCLAVWNICADKPSQTQLDSALNSQKGSPEVITPVAINSLNEDPSATFQRVSATDVRSIRTHIFTLNSTYSYVSKNTNNE